VTVEAHAAQSGNVSRLIAATEAGMIEGGLAIDDNTVLIVGTGKLSTAGSGSVWSVSQAEAGVVVSTFSTS
jgi:cyanophycinase